MIFFLQGRWSHGSGHRHLPRVPLGRREWGRRPREVILPSGQKDGDGDPDQSPGVGESAGTGAKEIVQLAKTSVRRQQRRRRCWRWIDGLTSFIRRQQRFFRWICSVFIQTSNIQSNYGKVKLLCMFPPSFFSENFLLLDCQVTSFMHAPYKIFYLHFALVKIIFLQK